MIIAKSDSDSTSLAPSSPVSPKRPVYYVQSPSRDSQDGDKTSSAQASSPTFNSPMESPSHPSIFGPHSLASSASRVSGTLRLSLGRKKRHGKGWQDCNVIDEEGDYDDLYGDKVFTRPCQYFILLSGFALLFTLLCLVVWGATRPYSAQVVVKSLTVNNFYFGEGSDWTGVPTKFMTVNCSLKMAVVNPATFFGIHVSSTPVNLFLSKLTVATGQLKRYYQPKKSRRTVSVNLEGSEVPLYGAGASLPASDDSGGVPFRLEFEIRSRGNVVGKLVKTKHHRHILCSFVVDLGNSRPIQFREDSCTYK